MIPSINHHHRDQYARQRAASAYERENLIDYAVRSYMMIWWGFNPRIARQEISRDSEAHARSILKDWSDYAPRAGPRNTL